MYKVTISTLFIDGKKHVRGDMVDLSAEQAAAFGNNVEPCEAPKPKAKPKAKAAPRKKKAAKSEG
ncbi:MAG: hypothetical protein VW879_10015 [Opitutae bacterium]|jgi:hypothetical protein